MSIPLHIRRIADAYPAEAAQVPAWERRHYLSADQQAAWAWRFEGIEPEEFAALEAEWRKQKGMSQ